MKTKTRIVTWMGYPEWGTPRQILSQQGSGVYTLPEKIRLYTVRKVVYDDSMTPMYAQPYPYEVVYDSLQKLYQDKKISPLLQDTPILDLDHYLKIYSHDEVCTEQ